MKKCFQLVVSIFVISTLIFPGNTTAQTVTTLTPPFNASGAIDFSPDGRMFISDFGGDYWVPYGTQIYEIAPDRQVSVFFDGVGGAAGMAFDNAGNLYVSNFITSAGIVSKIDPSGTIDFFSAGNANPTGIVVDAFNNVYISNAGAGRILKFDAAGYPLAEIVSDLFNQPHGLTIGTDGSLYVSNWGDGVISKVVADSFVSELATIPGDGNGHLAFGRNSVFVAARTVNQIYRVSLSGEVVLFAGSGIRGIDDGPALQATFSHPIAIAVNPGEDTLFVSDVTTLSGDTLHPNIIRSIALDGANTVEHPDNHQPATFQLKQNFPNPFNPSTTISFILPKQIPISLSVYNIQGQLIKELIRGEVNPGTTTIIWDGRDLQRNMVASGVYIYQLRGASFVQQRKMLLVR